MSFYDNERGLALPLTLLAMLVLSIFGATLWHASVAATIQTARRQENMQAHYIARGGAEALAEHIRINPAEVTRLIANTSSTNPARGTIGNGSFAAHVIRPVAGNANLLQIISTGTVANVTSQVTLNLARERISQDVFRGAVAQTSTQTLDLRSTDVTGDVYSAGPILSRRSGRGNYFFISRQDLSNLPSASFPEPPAGVAPTSLTNPIAPIAPGFYDTINGRNLTFLTGGPDTTVQVVVRTLHVARSITLLGGGRLELFITGNAVVRTGAGGFINIAGNESNLIVYLQKGASIQFQANPTFYGYIYAPEATVYMQSGQTRVRGSIVANRLTRGVGNQGSARNEITHVPPPPGRPILIHSFNYRKAHWSN